MQRNTQYLELRKAFKGFADGVPIRVKLEELAHVLYCTNRNVKIIIKKLSDAGMIEWSAGRGRGNLSELTFLASADDLLTKQAVELVEHGDLKGALELLNEFETNHSVREHFMEWLNGYFGYKEEERQEGRQDILRIPVYSKVVTLDPAQLQYAFDAHLMRQIFDTLIVYDKAKKEHVPHLAHYWKVNKEHTQWTFYLRKGVHFHHGRELNAQDVIFTLGRLMDPNNDSLYSFLVKHIRSMTAVDRLTVKIELTQPNYLFLDYLCSTAVSILPKEVCTEHPEFFFQSPIGTGPFKLERKDDYVIHLRAFPHYFQGRAHLDLVEIVHLPKETSMSRKYQRILYTSSIEDIDASEGWNTFEQIRSGCTYLKFNFSIDGPHQSLLFRKALHALLDRNLMIQELGDPYIRPAASFLPIGSHSDTTYYQHEYDWKALLKQMNYNGEKLQMVVCSSNESEGNWIAKRCVKAGIALEVYHCDKSELAQTNGHIYLSEILMGEDYNLSLLEIYQEKNCYLGTGIDSNLSKELEERVDQLTAEPTEQIRLQRLQELEGILVEDALVIFLLHKKINAAYPNTVRGVTLNNLGMIDFKNIWFDAATS